MNNTAAASIAVQPRQSQLITASGGAKHPPPRVHVADHHLVEEDELVLVVKYPEEEENGDSGSVGVESEIEEDLSAFTSRQSAWPVVLRSKKLPSWMKTASLNRCARTPPLPPPTPIPSTRPPPLPPKCGQPPPTPPRRRRSCSRSRSRTGCLLPGMAMVRAPLTPPPRRYPLPVPNGSLSSFTNSSSIGPTPTPPRRRRTSGNSTSMANSGLAVRRSASLHSFGRGCGWPKIPFENLSSVRCTISQAFIFIQYKHWKWRKLWSDMDKYEGHLHVY